MRDSRQREAAIRGGCAAGWLPPAPAEPARLAELQRLVHVLALRTLAELTSRGDSSLPRRERDIVVLARLVLSGPTPLKHLALDLGLAPSSVTALADRLEAGGFVRRSEDKSDRRRVLLEATPAAVGALQRSTGLLRDPARELLSVLSESEQDLLIALLERLCPAGLDG